MGSPLFTKIFEAEDSEAADGPEELAGIWGEGGDKRRENNPHDSKNGEKAYFDRTRIARFGLPTHGLGLGLGLSHQNQVPSLLWRQRDDTR